MKSLEGQRFGSFTVIEKTSQKKGPCFLWRCICSCGKEVLVSTHDLTGGRKKSCGCLRSPLKKNLLGQVFGRLTVIAECEDKLRGKTQWECHCECGTVTLVITNNLTSGKTRSCGCLRVEMSLIKAETIRDRNHVDATNVGSIRAVLLGTAKVSSVNKSGVRGVLWHKGSQKWIAKIGFKGKQISLGRYSDLEQAKKARKEGEQRYYGEYFEQCKD